MTFRLFTRGIWLNSFTTLLAGMRVEGDGLFDGHSKELKRLLSGFELELDAPGTRILPED
jgi:hypothetical protein